MELTPSLDELGWCPFGLVTGQPCPLCGGTRAVVSLAKFDLGSAWQYNALVVSACALAIACAVAFLGSFRRRKARPDEVLNHLRRWFRSPQRGISPGIATILLVSWAWNLGRW